jgi:hypothetical protein
MREDFVTFVRRIAGDPSIGVAPTWGTLLLLCDYLDDQKRQIEALKNRVVYGDELLA